MDGSVRFVGSLAALSLAVLVGGIIWASAASDVVAGLRYLAADRWGVVTLIDVYAGAFVVAVWIWFGERNKLVWFAWVLGLVMLGHAVSLAYLLRRVWRARRLADVFAGADYNPTRAV